MKKHVSILLFCFIACYAFAGGQVDSGRDSGSTSLEAGQFVNPDTIDAYAYINDYAFPYETNETEDLSIFVTLEKEKILTIGDNVNLFIGLHVNDKEYFKRNEGNYIVFIHNPEVLLRSEWKNAFISSLTKIRQTQQSGAVLGIFDSTANEIIPITSINSIEPALNRIRYNRKVYNIDVILDQSFRKMDAIENDYSTRFLWITDSDLLKSNNSARERAYFDYLMKLQSQNKISFSYLGYGEVPNWAVMNQSLKNAGGNSYYADDFGEVENTIWDDYNRFVYPTVENIKVNVSLMPWVTENRFDYRSDWYPVTGFRPVTGYYTHKLNNEIRNMDSGEHRIFLYYLSLSAVNKTESDLYYRTITANGNTPLGFCSVEYYSYSAEKTIYRTFPLQVRYTEDYDDYTAHTNQDVKKYTILQNTGFILKELSQLVNKRDYHTAILLVDSQIKLLERYLAEKQDETIAGDIETLNKNKELLMEQARSLNYIR